MVRTELIEPLGTGVMGLEKKLHVTPSGDPEWLNATASLNPRIEVTVAVTNVAPRCSTTAVSGSIERVKFGSPITFTWTSEVWRSRPVSSIPRTINECVPSGVVGDASTVKVEETVPFGGGVTGLGSKLTIKSQHRLHRLNSTGALNPPMEMTNTVKVAVSS